MLAPNTGLLNEQGAHGFLVGAKAGANMHRHQAPRGDVWLPSSQLDTTSGDAGLRQAAGNPQ
jgi:hypothetical protein